MSHATAGDKFMFSESTRTTCKCGLMVRLGEADGEPCAIHEMPFCPEFQRLDLVAYMRWLRNARDN